MRSGRSETRTRVSGLLFLAGGLLTTLAVLRLWAYLGAAPVATLPEIIRGADPAPTLLFLFRSHDCRTYAGLVEEWNRLHLAGEIRVRGVALGDAARGDDVGEPARGRPRFPVRADLADRAERLMLRLGFTRTPVSILLDREGRPRFILPPEADRERRERALALVRERAALLSSDTLGS